MPSLILLADRQVQLVCGQRFDLWAKVESSIAIQLHYADGLEYGSFLLGRFRIYLVLWHQN